MPQPRRVAFTLDLSWPLKRHADVFAGAQQYAHEHEWESVIDEYVVDTLGEHSQPAKLYDGVIGRISPQLAALGKELDLPIVNTWYNSPVRDELPGVFHDAATLGRLSAEHLMSRGLKRFAVLTRNDLAQLEVAASFHKTVQTAGFPCVVTRLPLAPARNYAAWKKVERKIERWMKNWQPPIGVSVCREVWGRMVVELCHRRGWRVPTDVAIVAGMNEELLCNHPRPSLTSLEIGYERIGYEAARMLDQMMKKRARSQLGNRTRKPRHLILPPVGLVMRESTDFFAVEDEKVAQALRFIAANSQRPINCNLIAKSIGIHPRMLQRRFARSVDWSISDEVRRVRIEHAKRLLAESKQSLVSIAVEVGFKKRMRMYEVFKRDVGCTPSKYRKQRKLEAQQ